MGIFDKVFGGSGGGSSGIRCHKCGKRLSNPAGGVYTGSGVVSAISASPYECKSCGTPFCVDCMARLRKGACPKCGNNIGW